MNSLCFVRLCVINEIEKSYYHIYLPLLPHRKILSILRNLRFASETNENCFTRVMNRINFFIMHENSRSLDLLIIHNKRRVMN